MSGLERVRTARTFDLIWNDDDMFESCSAAAAHRNTILARVPDARAAGAFLKALGPNLDGGMFTLVSNKFGTISITRDVRPLRKNFAFKELGKKTF